MPNPKWTHLFLIPWVFCAYIYLQYTWRGSRRSPMFSYTLESDTNLSEYIRRPRTSWYLRKDFNLLSYIAAAQSHQMHPPTWIGYSLWTNRSFIPYSKLDVHQDVLLTHGDSITELGANLQMCAISTSKVVAGIWNEKQKIYGVQFHPEVDLTVNGQQMIANFLVDICGLNRNYTIECRKTGCINYIREKVGNSKVLVSFQFGLFRTIGGSNNLSELSIGLGEWWRRFDCLCGSFEASVARGSNSCCPHWQWWVYMRHYTA